MESFDTIRQYLHLYTGNDLGFGRILANATEERHSDSWRQVFIRFKKEFPEEIPEITEDDANDLIPYEWDGTWADLARRLKKQRPDISFVAWKSRIETARRQGRISRTSHADFTAEQFIGEAPSGEDLWSAVEKATSKAIITQQDSRWSEVTFHNNGQYIGIAFLADQHIGGKFTDHERMREDAEIIRDTDNLYVIHAGDFIDNFLGNDKPTPTNKQVIRPCDQWRLAEHYISLFDDKIVGIVAGNHDLWTDKLADFDPLQDIAHEIGSLYHTNELNIRVLISGQPYHICVRHKRRGNSQVHPGQVVKKMWADGESDFDIGVVGHTHTPVVENFLRHGIERWAIRPGSYKIIDGYAEELGFPRDRLSCPMVILSPYTRQIHAFPDLRLGINTLEMLNNG